MIRPSSLRCGTYYLFGRLGLDPTSQTGQAQTGANNILTVLCVDGILLAAGGNDMQVLQDNDRLFVRLDRGVELFTELTKLATTLGWQSAHISGIGALEDTELGFFQLDKKDYKRKIFKKEAELLSMDGNLAMLDGKPFWHIHAVLGDENFQCFGGHLFKGTVAVTVEINVRVFNQQVDRALDQELRFNQLQFCPIHTQDLSS